MSREHVLHKVRTSLGRAAGQSPGEPPPSWLQAPTLNLEEKIAGLFARIEALSGKTFRAATPHAAREYVASVIGDAAAVATASPFLGECGITSLPQVRSGIADPAELRSLASTCRFGITSADCALAETGSLVMLSGPGDSRLVSLLPPVHLAVLPADRILANLDEFFVACPLPVEQRSSMVLITGPSRTADIEQILVRGVHGPGETHVVVVG